MDVLRDSNILSAPIVVSAGVEELGSGAAEMSPQLLGWLSIADVLQAFLEDVRRKRGGPLPTNMLALMALLEAEGPAFSAKPLVTVRGVEDRGLVFAGDSGTTTLLDAVRNHFLQPGPYGEAKVVHRLAVFDAHGEVKHIAGDLGPAADASLEQLGLLKLAHQPVTVDPHVPTLLAMDMLLQNQINGAPVVTKEGELVANLSISDLRGLGSQHWGALALPVAEFLALEHATTYLGFSASPRHPSGDKGTPPQHFASQRRAGGPATGDIQLFTCSKGTTLRQLLDQARGGRCGGHGRGEGAAGGGGRLRLLWKRSPCQLVENHIHRVFVMEGDQAAAVLTLTDILRFCSGLSY
eukprot:scaffold11.g3971.t1